ncbi:Nuclear GTPase SLIP-GC, partial [Merops nubicus]
RRSCTRDPNPAGGNEEALKDFGKMQSDLKEVLMKSEEKLLLFLNNLRVPETRQEIEYLRGCLMSLRPDILLDPIYIGLFGSTGAGKTTLLNAILDKKFFLAVSGSTACTSCVVQVNASPCRQHEAKIHLLTDTEWKDELKNLVALAAVDEGEEEEEEEDDEVRQDAVSKISAIYGEGAVRKGYEELCKKDPVVNIPPSRCITLKEKDEEKFSEMLWPYIRNPNSSGAAEAETSEEKRKKQVWPLIKNVEVTVPELQGLPEGVVFVDIPGMGDSNSKRDAMWKENINKCSVIWVVSSMERILGDKNHVTVLKEGMKAFQRGMCKDISLVVTKADCMNLPEYQSKEEAILERNEHVKQEKSKIMKANLEKKLPSDSQVLKKRDLVYTTSAWEYWDGKMLSREDTEIPKLRGYIQTFYIAQKRNKLKNCASDALAILSLIQSLRSNPDAQDVNRSYWNNFLEKIFGELRKDIEKCFAPINQPLNEGLNRVKRVYNKTVNKILTRAQGYKGYHRTLKAVCQRNGLYVSRAFGRIDVNTSLAQPIYENIDLSFGIIFSVQMDDGCTLKDCLKKFEEAMKKELQKALQENLLADEGDKLRFLEQETNFIIRETEKVILERKAEIYSSLTTSIENDLLQYYREAARQSGIQAYIKMKNILSEGIKKEVENGMFEKAQKKMRQHFQALK